MTARDRDFLFQLRDCIAEIERAAGPSGAKGIKRNGAPISQLDAVLLVAGEAHRAINDRLYPDIARARAGRLAKGTPA